LGGGNQVIRTKGGGFNEKPANEPRENQIGSQDRQHNYGRQQVEI